MNGINRNKTITYFPSLRLMGTLLNHSLHVLGKVIFTVRDAKIKWSSRKDTQKRQQLHSIALDLFAKFRKKALKYRIRRLIKGNKKTHSSMK